MICVGTLACVSAAEAMPALSQFGNTQAGVSIGGAQVDKAEVVVTRRVVREAPRVIVRRPPRVIVRRPFVRPFVRRPVGVVETIRRF